MLEDIILKSLFNKDLSSDVEQVKYDYVMSALGKEIYQDGEKPLTNAIVKGIAVLVNTNSGNRKNDVFSSITQQFCINFAYEYLLFLQNDHEIHEQDTMSR